MYAEIAKNRIFERQSYVPRCHYPTVAYSRLMAAFVNSTLSLAPLHECRHPAATHPKRAKTAFPKCKRRIERHFWGTLPPDFRFGRRRPLFFIFIACESLFGCRVVFARTDHLQGFSRISSHPVCRPSTVACTGISIHTPGVPAVCGSSGIFRNRKDVKKTPC